MTQRGIWADPRWGLRRRYRGLRSDEKAAILNALNETRGQLNVLRVTPHAPIRGSFATSELLTNNTFASGTTGWTTGAEYSLSVSDRVMRATRTSVTAISDPLYQSVSLAQNIPYVARAMTLAGRGSFTALGPEFASFESSSGAPGYRTVVRVPQTAGAQNVGVIDGQNTSILAGDYFQVPWLSLARCALIDNGPNLLLRSEALDNASWTKSGSTSPFSVVGPDGNATLGGAFLKEDSSTGQHVAFQSVTVVSGAADYAFCVAGKASGRNFIRLALTEGTGSTVLSQFFNLGTGAVGATGTTGVNWSNRRTFIASMGNGWYFCAMVGRKTNAATSLSASVIIGSADGTDSYTGNNTDGINCWRATLAQSSFPTRLIQTTSAATSGATQTGGTLYTKGWPVSTSGLLLTGDWLEIGGELKQMTAPINSDAAGLAYMQFRPSLAGSPADNDPVVVYEPFGRFIYPAGVREIENQFGIYADCTMELEEVYV